MVALVVAMTATAASDPAWTKSFAPVADKASLGNVKTAAGADGSVYACTKYDQTFSFADASITDPEGILSSCIVKYDKTGAEKWAASFIGGNATVNAMTVDTDGSLYVAGGFLDAVLKIKGTGDAVELTGSEDAVTAFVAKFSADGAVSNVIKVTSKANEEIVNSGMYYPEVGDVSIMPENILVDGDKVYVTATYTGDVVELPWKGSYLNVFDFMYSDNKSIGVFSVAKSDLSGIASECTLANTETVSYNQYYAEAFKYMRNEGKPYVAFIGFGKLTLKAGDVTEDFVFNTTTDESGNKEHALVFSKLDGNSVKFGAANHDKDARAYTIVGGDVIDGVAYIGGTFYGNFPLNNMFTVTDDTPFAAAINLSDGSVKWSQVAGKAGKAIFAGAHDAECSVVTSSDAFTFAVADGTPGEVETFSEVEVKHVSKNDKCGAMSHISTDITDAKVYISGMVASSESKLQPVSEATTWDFSQLTVKEDAPNYNSSDKAIKLSAETTPSNTDEYLYSDYAGTDFTAAETFKADAISFTGQYPIRKNQFAQNGVLKFNTTKDGTIKVTFSDTGSGAKADAVKRYLVVNDVQTDYWTSRENNGTENPYPAQLNVTTGEIEVSAGNVTITGTSAIVVSKIVFTPKGSSAVKNVKAANAQKAAVKKYVKNGQLVIETANGIFSVSGAQVK